MLHLLKALEIAESCIMARSWTLSLLLHRFSVFPLCVSEGDVALTDSGLSDEGALRVVVIVKFVLWCVVVGGRDIELSSAETIISFLDRELRGRQLVRISDALANTVRMLVETGSW